MGTSSNPLISMAQGTLLLTGALLLSVDGFTPAMHCSHTLHSPDLTLALLSCIFLTYPGSALSVPSDV